MPESKTAVFDIHAIARNFPASASTMLIDTRLTDEPQASARVFRAYAPAPRTITRPAMSTSSYFQGEPACSSAQRAREPFEVGPGRLIFFKKETVHGMPEILEHPFVVLAVDTPRRDPSDVIFLDPSDGTPDSFLQSAILY